MTGPLLLLAPPSGGPGVEHPLRPTENVRLAYAAACLRTGRWPVVVFDADVEATSPAATVEQLAALAPAAVLIQLLHRDIDAARELAAAAKQLPGPPWVIAFDYAVDLSGHALLDMHPAFDAVIPGQPEAALLAIAAAATPADWARIPGLLQRNPAGPPATVLAPAGAAVVGGEGCYGRCAFCSVPVLRAHAGGPAPYARAPEAVADEIAWLVREYGVRQLHFADENFIGPPPDGPRRALAFAQLLHDRALDIRYSIYCRPEDITEDVFTELRASGLRLVRYDIEPRVARVREHQGPGLTEGAVYRAQATLRRLELRGQPSFTMFEPAITLAELGENLRFVARHGLFELVNPTCASTFPGAPFTRPLRREGCLASPADLDQGFLSEVTFADPAVSAVRADWLAWRVRLDQMTGGLARELEALADFAAASLADAPAAMMATIHSAHLAIKRPEADFVTGRIERALIGLPAPDTARTLGRASRALARFRTETRARRVPLPPAPSPIRR